MAGPLVSPLLETSLCMLPPGARMSVVANLQGFQLNPKICMQPKTIAESRENCSCVLDLDGTPGPGTLHLTEEPQ